MDRQKNSENEKAILYVVAAPIGNLQETTPGTLKVLESVDVTTAEDTRNTLKLLTHFDIRARLISHHQHDEIQSADGPLELLHQGQDIVLVSDTGYPLTSNPSCVVTQKVIEEGSNVAPISGSDAILNALVSSGMDARYFLFYGFSKSGEKERIRELYGLKYYSLTVVFYETPHRVEKMFASYLEVLGNRNIYLIREPIRKYEEFLRGTIGEILEITEELRGEMVIAMKSSRETKGPGEDFAAPLVHEQINTYIREGLTANEATKRVARKCGPSENETYKQYHGLC